MTMSSTKKAVSKSNSTAKCKRARIVKKPYCEFKSVDDFLKTDELKALAAEHTRKAQVHHEAIKRLEALCDANNWCYCAVLTSAIHHVQACAPLDTFPSEAVEAAQCTLAMTDSFVVLQAANLHPRVIQSIEFRVYNKGTKYEEILIPHSVHKYYDV